MIQNEEIWPKIGVTVIDEKVEESDLKWFWPYTNESNEWTGEEEWFDLIWKNEKRQKNK